MGAVSVDTLLMHPLLARVEAHTGGWQCPFFTREGGLKSRFRLGARQASQGGGGEHMERWMARRGVRVFEEDRGLLDTKGLRVWRVDLVCEVQGRCTLVALSRSTRRVWTGAELAYARRLKRLARTTYGADARVMAIKVYAEGRISSREITDEPDFRGFVPWTGVLKAQGPTGTPFE